MARYSYKRNSGMSELAAYAIGIVVTLFIALAVGCTDEKGAKKALDSEGFTEVVIDGWGGPVACGKDWNATDFTAKNTQGKVVKGTVCSGLMFKNATIRW